MQHLDVAGVAGYLAFRVLEALHSLERQRISDAVVDEDAENETRVFICDIDPAMLDVGRRRANAKGLGEACSLIWTEGDSEALKFEDASTDGYTIAFGIKNVTHIEKALSEAYRVLRRGGRFLCFELSHVNIPSFRQLYDFYSFSVIPSIGEIVARDRTSYQYLVERIHKFPSQGNFTAMIKDTDAVRRAGA